MCYCNICQKKPIGEVQRAAVRSNVRRFCDQQFAIWRCPNCRSIHASQPVDLDYYYKHYPLHWLKQTKVNWMLNAMYRSQLKRLRKIGLRKEHTLLDYGCGSGLFIDYLRRVGYRYAFGFDAYSERFSDCRILERSYDFVITQDVIEHVDKPWELIKTLNQLSKPGTVIAIGTPNAESIDMNAPDKRIHTLHQPYHRHILSRGALLTVGERVGWKLIRYFPTMYTNTLVPFVNTIFVTYYFNCFDNTLDLSLEPIRVNSWRLWTPKAFFFAFFGYFFSPETDVMAVFRRD
ncbi:MAG: class I SAM-dependent methyltransferase [Deltaproteobacteria bacterium]|nr:class I SAM-dependent methyltransferase [Deltaproteobacteria bacterium]